MTCARQRTAGGDRGTGAGLVPAGSLKNPAPRPPGRSRRRSRHRQPASNTALGGSTRLPTRLDRDPAHHGRRSCCVSGSGSAPGRPAARLSGRMYRCAWSAAPLTYPRLHAHEAGRQQRPSARGSPPPRPAARLTRPHQPRPAARARLSVAIPRPPSARSAHAQRPRERIAQGPPEPGPPFPPAGARGRAGTPVRAPATTKILRWGSY